MSGNKMFSVFENNNISNYWKQNLDYTIFFYLFLLFYFFLLLLLVS